MSYLSISGWNLKKANQYPKIFQYAKFHAKTKNTYIYDKKMLYLDIFGLEFEKAIVIFEINSLEFV